MKSLFGHRSSTIWKILYRTSWNFRAALARFGAPGEARASSSINPLSSKFVEVLQPKFHEIWLEGRKGGAVGRNPLIYFWVFPSIGFLLVIMLCISFEDCELMCFNLQISLYVLFFLNQAASKAAEILPPAVVRIHVPPSIQNVL